MLKCREKCLPRILLACLGSSILCGAAIVPAFAQQQRQGNAAIPDFSLNKVGWVSIGTNWIAVPGSPQPVTCDPAHPCIGNNTGRQPTFRVADTENPNLTPFARTELKKSNDEVLSGKAMYSRESRCWATGVPTVLLNPVQPTFFIQMPDKIVMISQMDDQVRHIYLDVAHSSAPKPSWYGESIGHYEGDTLVVDTVGQNTKTFLDNFRTPHSDKLHVVERFHLVDGGKMLQADVTIEDPGVFLKPMQVIHRWRRTQAEFHEMRCAEGELSNPFQQNVEPIPVADKPDF
jgi:hypothetical protein